MTGQTEVGSFWWDLVTGSRAEGLALETGWGHGAADWDTMFIYGTLWTVQIPARNGVTTDEGAPPSYLTMSSHGCPPCFCRVRVTGDAQDFAAKVGQGIARGAPSWMFRAITFSKETPFPSNTNTFLSSVLENDATYRKLDSVGKNIPQCMNFLVPWSIGEKQARTVFIERNGVKYLSSADVQQLLKDHGKNIGRQSGPAQQVPGLVGPWRGHRDLVTALICSHPFPCIRAFLRRHQNPHLNPHHATDWPPDQFLTYIGVMPGIIVPTGNAGSTDEEQQMQWRLSFSAQELLLSQHMPPWVKAGYRAFKYTVKRNISQASTSASNTTRGARKSLCSFHLKTILLWTLEESVTWDRHCSFRLVLLLLVRLDYHLKQGKLPHYFNPECDLFEFVSPEKRRSIHRCVKRILTDPVAAMVQTLYDMYMPGVFVNCWASPTDVITTIRRDELDNGLKRYRSALRVAGLWANHNTVRPSALSYKIYPHHDDVIKWKHFPRYWPFVRGIYRSPVYSDADQRKHQSSASLVFVRGIHRWPVNSPHKWPVTRKMFPFDDVIMKESGPFFAVL